MTLCDVMDIAVLPAALLLRDGGSSARSVCGCSPSLAALGLNGVLAHAVSLRRREMGIRTALGANSADLVGLILRQGLAMAVLDTAIGAVGSVALSGVLESLLFEIEATDLRVLLVASTVLLATAGLAAWLPARKASRTDPAICLRQD